jgi:hypothetical protein
MTPVPDIHVHSSTVAGHSGTKSGDFAITLGDLLGGGRRNEALRRMAIAANAMMLPLATTTTARTIADTKLTKSVETMMVRHWMVRQYAAEEVEGEQRNHQRGRGDGRHIRQVGLADDVVMKATRNA